jgi:hypothetical protein
MIGQPAAPATSVAVPPAPTFGPWRPRTTKNPAGSIDIATNTLHDCATGRIFGFVGDKMTSLIQLLDWEEWPRPGVHEAQTPLGTYRLHDLPLGCAVAFHSPKVAFCNVSDKQGVTVVQAKQLAQHDFEARKDAWFACVGNPLNFL